MKHVNFSLYFRPVLAYTVAVQHVGNSCEALREVKKIATGAYFHPSYPIPDILPLIPSLPFPATGGCIPGATGV
jgi:hypothetical protein